MREILFKAKAVDDGRWVQGYVYFDYFSQKQQRLLPCVIMFNEGYPRKVRVEVDKETVCQFTGATDKIGNKVFENDKVLDLKGLEWKVTWHTTYCRLRLRRYEHRAKRYVYRNMSRINNHELIKE
jgi:hypothetical protein